jgi:DNA-binding beta-propeller fold protein YncE
VLTITASVAAQTRGTSSKSVGDGGPAVKAQLNAPSSIAVDDAGNLYVYEAIGEAVRKVDLARGTITTVARVCDPPVQHPPPDGCFGLLSQLQIDSSGKLLLSEFTYDRLSLLDPSTLRLSVIASYRALRPDGDGGPAPLARFSGPSCSAPDDKGNIFICDAGYYIRRIDRKTRAISIVAGNGKRGFAGDHGPAIAAEFGLPLSVAVDRAGDIFIADDTSNRIRRVDANTGVIETVAGTGDITKGSFVAQEFHGEGGLATAARMIQPQSLAFDQNENLMFVVNDRVCRIDKAKGTLSTIAGTGNPGSAGMVERRQKRVLERTPSRWTVKEISLSPSS